MSSRLPKLKLKTFYRNTVPHEVGITCSCLDLQFDALFDTGASHVLLRPDLIDKISDQVPMVLDSPPGYPPLYIVSLTIHLDIGSHSQYCVVYEGDENLIPPRIFTREYAQTNKKNFVTFNPKSKQPIAGEHNFNYKTLFNKETWMTMSNGTPGFYFSIGQNLETALFDTGSLKNVIVPNIVDRIGIEKYPPVNLWIWRLQVCL